MFPVNIWLFRAFSMPVRSDLRFAAAISTLSRGHPHAQVFCSFSRSRIHICGTLGIGLKWPIARSGELECLFVLLVPFWRHPMESLRQDVPCPLPSVIPSLSHAY